MRNRFRYMWLIFVTALSLTVGPSFLAAQEKAPADENQDEQSLIQAAQMMRRSGMVQFNFTEIDIVKFIRFMSELLQENIIVTPAVKGKVSVISPKPVPLGQARQVMLSVLEMNGLTIENLGSYSKVLPGKIVSKESEVRRGKMSPAQGEQTVTQVVPLDYVTADFVVKAVQMAVTGVGVMPAGKGNDIVLSGKAVDVNRAVNLIRKIDVAESYKMSRTVPIQYSSPSLVASRLTELAKSGPLQGLLAVADEGSKKIVLVGESDVLKEAQRIIKELDVYSRGGDFHIYKLEHADAKQAATQLGQVLAVAAKLQPSKEGQMPTTVVPDLATNSLIFAVPQYQYDSLLSIIRQIGYAAKAGDDPGARRRSEPYEAGQRRDRLGDLRRRNDRGRSAGGGGLARRDQRSGHGRELVHGLDHDSGQYRNGGGSHPSDKDGSERAYLRFDPDVEEIRRDQRPVHAATHVHR